MNDLSRHWDLSREVALNAIDRVGKSGWWILGSAVKEFEASLAHFWGLPHAVGCANGLDAIEIALRCLRINPGDKVLTTPVSAFATTLAIVRAGGVPVFSDVDDSGLIDLDKARLALEKDDSIRFFVPVHLYGHSLALDRLEALKDDFNLKVVEDCAQSIGAKSNGRVCGSVGEFATTSFYPTKNLGCIGDGGALLTSDQTLDRLARQLRDYGQEKKYVHSFIGLNSRLDELQAAVLKDAFIPLLKKHTVARIKTSSAYIAEINNPRLRVPVPPSNSESVWHLFPIIINGNRSSFVEHLKLRGIETGIHYPIPIHKQEALNNLGTRAGSSLQAHLPVAESFCESVLSLPIHPFLTNEDIVRVVQACNDWKG
jgi:dTDP-4-amino-4,6-dideoxygalactose transaminase